MEKERNDGRDFDAAEYLKKLSFHSGLKLGTQPTSQERATEKEKRGGANVL